MWSLVSKLSISVAFILCIFHCTELPLVFYTSCLLSLFFFFPFCQNTNSMTKKKGVVSFILWCIPSTKHTRCLQFYVSCKVTSTPLMAEDPRLQTRRKGFYVNGITSTKWISMFMTNFPYLHISWGRCNMIPGRYYKLDLFWSWRILSFMNFPIV